MAVRTVVEGLACVDFLAQRVVKRRASWTASEILREIAVWDSVIAWHVQSCGRVEMKTGLYFNRREILEA